MRRRAGGLAGLLVFLGVLGVGARAQEAPVAAPPPAFRVFFENNTSFPSSRLKEHIAKDLERFGESRGSLSYLDDAAYTIERFYRAEGFPEALVDFEVRETPAGKAIVFEVTEGRRVEIESMSVVGNFHFTRDQLLALAETEYLESGRPFYRRGLARDLERIRTVYFSAGYAGVKVDMQLIEAPSKKKVQVLVRIEEGVRVFLTEIRFAGNERVETQVLEGKVVDFLVPSRPIHPVLAQEVRAKVLDYYGRHGFPLTRIDIAREIDRQKGRAVLTLTIREGPSARFGAVTVSGNHLTMESIIRGLLLFKEGEPFDQDKVWKSQVELYSTALFKRVTLKRGEFQPDPGSAERGTVDYEVIVEEEKPLQVEFYAGWGSYELLRGGVTVRHTNVFGTGRTAEIGAEASFRDRSLEAALIDPLLLGRGVVLSWRNFVEERDFPSFDRREFETAIDAGIPLTRNIETRLGYRYSYSAAANITDPVEAAANENVGLSGPVAGFTWDTRNNPVNPENGVLVGAGYDFSSRALGGEISFNRLTATVRGYLGMWDGWVLAGAARSGLIVPFGETDDIPIQERFFRGGPTTVRSFPQFELGPKTLDGDPIGGETFLVLNTELRFPIYKVLGGAAFVDAGQVWRFWEDYGSNGLSYGIGGGLHLRTPIGPIRVDAAWNPDPGENEKRWMAHVSVGFAF